MHIVESAKQHPWLFGSVAVGAIVLVLMLRGSSNATVGVSGPTGDVASGDAFQQMELQVQRDIQLAGINAQASQAHDAASLQATQIAADVTNNANQIGADVALSQISASLEALTNHDTLQAQTDQKQIQSGVDIATVQATNQTEQLQTVAGALVSQAQIQASTIQAVTAKKCGWLGVVFGC